MRHTTTTRPNVALLLDYLSNAYQRDLIDGASRAARERGANTWIFVGGWFKDEALGLDDNVVYQLVRKPAIDGVVAAMSSLVTLLGRAAGERILRRFQLPTVSVGLSVNGVPSVRVDNRTGLRQMCEHLVRDHAYRRFAMIGGPANNEDSEDRIAACHEALDALGAALPEQRVTRQGFTVQAGIDGVRELLDKRRTVRDTLDALICASDLVAEGALKALAERGVTVPERIAVTGFDNLERSPYLSPPLTTVHQPVIDLAHRATRSLFRSLEGSAAPLAETLPSTLVLRRSCGCLPSQEPALPPQKDEPTPPRPSRAIAHIMQRRELIYAALSRAAGPQFKGMGLGWEGRWLTALRADLEAPTGRTFLSSLDAPLRRPGQCRRELDVWLEVLATFRQELLRDVDDQEVCRRIEDIMHAARLSTAGAIEWFEVNRWMVTSEALQGALGAIDRLVQVAGQEAFWTRLQHELAQLSIHTCFVTLFTDSGRERSRLLWAYSSRETLPELRSQTFASSELLPGRLATRPRDDAMVVRTLVSNGQPLGTAFLSYTAAHVASYEPLIGVIAAAIERSPRA